MDAIPNSDHEDAVVQRRMPKKDPKTLRNRCLKKTGWLENVPWLSGEWFSDLEDQWATQNQYVDFIQQVLQWSKILFSVMLDVNKSLKFVNLGQKSWLNFAHVSVWKPGWFPVGQIIMPRPSSASSSWYFTLPYLNELCKEKVTILVSNFGA